MEAKVVVVELEHAEEKTVYGTSGLMLNNSHVIVTSNIFHGILDKDEHFKQALLSTPNRLHVNSLDCRGTTTNLSVVLCQQNSNGGSRTFDVKRAKILGAFSSANLRRTVRRNLRDWCVDSEENRRDLDVSLSVFFVLSIIDGGGGVEAFRTCLRQWWDGVKNEPVERLDEVLVRCAPFGNRGFLESHNRGVVSNVVGPGSCLILSDCPTVTGCEGSPVFKFNGKARLPIGIVISCECWWRGDKVDLTMVADVRSLLVELLSIEDEPSFVPHHQLLANIKSSLLQVYCGSTWGTGILLSHDGIVITNSHVINSKDKLTLHWKGHTLPATLVYRTPDDKVFDLAVLTCDVTGLHGLKPISVCESPALIGNEVYSAGFCLFPKDVVETPTLSRGYVSMCSPSMVKTTCCVNAGMSGGPILNGLGQLQGVIVSNTKLQDGKLRVFPRLNMAIPYLRIKPILDEFITSKDCGVLEKLCTTHHKDLVYWNAFEPSKL